MRHVFLSYAGKSQQLAANVAAALKGLGADPFVYHHPNRHTSIDADTQAKLKLHCEAASFFVQILEGSGGTSILEGDKPLLQLEVEWYLAKRSDRGERRPSPLVLSLERPRSDEEGKRLTRLLEWLQASNIDVQPADGPDQVLEVCVGWYARMRVTPAEVSIIDGYLDVEVGQQSVNKALEDALLHGRLVPQTLLYDTPVGAMLWTHLTTRHETRV